MNVTITGYAILGFAAIACLTMPVQLLQAILFFSSFSATAVINFNNYGMSPCVVFVPAYLFWKIISGDLFRPTSISRDHLFLLTLLVVFLVISVASLLLNQATRVVESFEVTQTIYIAFGVVITLLMSVEFAREDRLEVAINALRAGAVFIAIWGVVQAACYYAGVAYPTDLFNNSTSHAADMFDQRAGGGSIIRIASVAVEPSFMAVSLLIFGTFGATLVSIEPRFRTRGWIISVSLVLLVVAASTSSTAYAGMAVLIILLGLRRPGLMLVLVGIAGLLTAIALASFPAFQAAIYEMTLGKANGGSYQDRSGKVLAAFEMIPEKPWLGWGWGGIVSYSIITQLLTNVGAIGTICFIAAIGGTIIASRAARIIAAGETNWKLIAYAQGCENALIVFMAQSVVAGFHYVVADYWLLWAMTLAIPSRLISRTAQATYTMRQRLPTHRKVESGA